MISFVNKINKRISDASISKKLYFTITFTALLVIIELCTLWFSISTLSAVRSYVGGEGLWSKAQKDAILNLRTYAYTKERKNYIAFKEFLKVPYADKAARLEMEKENPDYDMIRKNLVIGRNHPDDIDGMIVLLKRFRQIYYLELAFTAWAGAEPYLDQLNLIGEQLDYLVQHDADQAEIDVLLLQIDLLNTKLTILEDKFSYALGEGARWLENLVLRIVWTLSLTIGITSIFIAVSINRSLKKGVDAIIDGANKIKKGAIKTRVPVYSADEIGLVATAFNDMTDTLDHKISELRATEKQMVLEKERAEKSEWAKKQFLINMSHEMRTPMNAILGFANYLDQSITKPDQSESLQMIIKSGNHMLVTLNGILDFSNIEAGEIVFANKPFNVRETVEFVVKLITPEALKKNLTVHFEVSKLVPEFVSGDDIRLTQILLNLASNAVKFTEKGEVFISAAILREKDDSVFLEFAVKDTGVGIPLDRQENIFYLFEQAINNMTRKFGGTGIGLSIVKQLVNLQHGEIAVDSRPGKGSSFYVQLPFKKYPADKVTDANKSDKNLASGEGIKVLVVEDNEINQLLVLKLLEKKGYEATVASNGKIAIDKLLAEDFDIVLMDLQMPEMDGYQATKVIRSMESDKKDIPIIAMTAHTIIGDREECLAMGMTEYIAKPYSSSELFDKMTSVLDGAERLKLKE